MTPFSFIFCSPTLTFGQDHPGVRRACKRRYITIDSSYGKVAEETARVLRGHAVSIDQFLQHVFFGMEHSFVG
jgi:hypothetical protein